MLRPCHAGIRREAGVVLRCPSSSAAFGRTAAPLFAPEQPRFAVRAAPVDRDLLSDTRATLFSVGSCSVSLPRPPSIP